MQEHTKQELHVIYSMACEIQKIHSCVGLIHIHPQLTTDLEVILTLRIP